MRIICDHCDRPISGTVKRFPGNFNLHPDCLPQFGKDFKHGLSAVTALHDSRHEGRATRSNIARGPSLPFTLKVSPLMGRFK